MSSPRAGLSSSFRKLRGKATAPDLAWQFAKANMKQLLAKGRCARRQQLRAKPVYLFLRPSPNRGIGGLCQTNLTDRAEGGRERVG